MGFSFVSGLITIFAPCIWPLLPIILSSSATGGKQKPLGIVVGIMLSFGFFTLAISYIVKIIPFDPNVLRLFAVIVIALLGLTLVVPKLTQIFEGMVSRLLSSLGTRAARQHGDGFKGGFMTGLALGLVWSPCAGPILVTIATLAATQAVNINIILITVAYVLGVAIPLFIFATAGSWFFHKSRYVSRHTARIQQIFGVIMILTALAIYTNYDKVLQAKLLDTFPAYTDFISKLESNKEVKNQLEVLKQKKRSAKISVSGEDDFTGAKVKPEDLEVGCARQDCIPSINNPNFDPATAADRWLKNSDIIFGIKRNGVVRAYPQRILNWHEIINDDIAGDKIAVTFCPLCGSAVAFLRKVGGKSVEFGVSGKLYNNDLVMYDRLEGNLWQQITGEAIAGPAARRNEVLTRVSLITTTWQKWRREDPDTQVLSRHTGYSRNYDRYPYGTYEQDNQIYFGLPNSPDQRLPLKEVVYGFDVAGKYKAYTVKALTDKKLIADKIAGQDVVIEGKKDGEVILTVKNSGETSVPFRTFWFAWAAFHPGTELYK
ncbi:DUF3179 domain-containing protein [Candidatus Roizmanbacteria bacterium]|nr:DUF3179 domain-containing protein [Candidatus Roizmanbacteria bacterium]